MRRKQSFGSAKANSGASIGSRALLDLNSPRAKKINSNTDISNSKPTTTITTTNLVLSTKRKMPFGEGESTKVRKRKIDKHSPFDMSSLMIIMKNASLPNSFDNKEEEDKENTHHFCNAGDCHICQGRSQSKAPCSLCEFCEKKACTSCLKKCDKCFNFYCSICYTYNYEAKYERVFCLSCNMNNEHSSSVMSFPTSLIDIGSMNREIMNRGGIGNHINNSTNSFFTIKTK